MTDPVATRSQDVSVPADDVPELIVTVLTKLGWQGLFVNDRLKLATAKDFRSRAGVGVNWQFEFLVSVAWYGYPGSHRTSVQVTVTEKKNRWTQQDCEQRCADICVAVSSFSIQLEQQMREEVILSDQYGSAMWADDAELQDADYADAELSSLRFLIGKDDLGRIIAIPPEGTQKHGLVCGPTGCGKTSGILIPNLIQRLAVSAIVTEATAGAEAPDLYAKTAGYRQQAGHQVYYFNPDDAASHCLNPIDAVKDIESAMLMATLLIENTSLSYKQASDPIWENSERHLLTALFYHAAAVKANLALVRTWVRDGQVSLHDRLAASPLPGVVREYRGFLNLSTEGYRNGVLSGVLQRLSLWLNPKIAKLTETTELDIHNLGNQLFTFYLAMPAHKTHLRPLAALMLNFLLTMVLEQKNTAYPVMLILDEFTNYGYIPGFVEKLGTIRHKKIPVIMGFQDYSQVKKRYGMEDAETIFTQLGTRIFFRTRAVETAKKISDALGRKTIVERRVTSGGHISVKEFGRQLLDPAEIMKLESDQTIVFTPDTNPCLLRRFDWIDYIQQTSVRLPTRTEKFITDELKEFCAEMSAKPEFQKEWEGAPKQTRSDKSYPTQQRTRAQPARKKTEKRRPRQEEPAEFEREEEESEPAPPII